jgi:hypothetical protein
MDRNMPFDGVSPVKSSALRAVILSLVLVFGPTACLTSEAPQLSAADLTEPAGFGGAYFATAFPDDPSDDTGTIDAQVEAIGERTYRLTFIEGERKDEPVLLRMLKLNDGRLLGVFSDPDPAKGALYTIVTQASNGGWVFRNVEFQPERRDQVLRNALTRHGASAVDFDDAHDEIKGSLTAANLRALFSDPDFTGALSMEKGFRLSPTTPALTTNTLD